MVVDALGPHHLELKDGLRKKNIRKKCHDVGTGAEGQGTVRTHRTAIMDQRIDAKHQTVLGEEEVMDLNQTGYQQIKGFRSKGVKITGIKSKGFKIKGFRIKEQRIKGYITWSTTAMNRNGTDEITALKTGVT